jgi:hypothetical protein
LESHYREATTDIEYYSKRPVNYAACES